MSNDISDISPEEFVQEFRGLKDHLVRGYFSTDSEISRVQKLVDAGLTTDQLKLVQNVMDDALTDALYTVLIGLEGGAAISQYQIMYKLLNEASNELTGQIESLAWEKFHGQST